MAEKKAPTSFLDPDLAALIGLPSIATMEEERSESPKPHQAPPKQYFDLQVEQSPGETVQSDGTEFFPLSMTPIRNNDSAMIVNSSAESPGINNTEVTFGSASAHDQKPVNNEQAATVYSHKDLTPQAPQQTLPNTDVQFFPSPDPVNNEQSAVVYRAQHAFVPQQILPNRDVQFFPYPAPISNETTAVIQHSPQAESHQDATSAGPVTNNSDDVRFSPGSQPISNDPNRTIMHHEQIFSDDAQRSPGVINVGNGSVQILPGRYVAPQTITPSNDVFFGGGGDTTKLPNSDGVSIGGFSMPDQGASDVFMAPSGNTTKQAGEGGDVLFGGKNSENMPGDDVHMTPSGDVQKTPNQEDTVMSLNVGTIGNQEATISATGEPTANKDHTDVGFGGRGKPRNIRG